MSPKDRLRRLRESAAVLEHLFTPAANRQTGLLVVNLIERALYEWYRVRQDSLLATDLYRRHHTTIQEYVTVFYVSLLNVRPPPHRAPPFKRAEWGESSRWNNSDGASLVEGEGKCVSVVGRTARLGPLENLSLAENRNDLD